MGLRKTLKKVVSAPFKLVTEPIKALVEPAKKIAPAVLPFVDPGLSTAGVYGEKTQAVSLANIGVGALGAAAVTSTGAFATTTAANEILDAGKTAAVSGAAGSFSNTNYLDKVLSVYLAERDLKRQTDLDLLRIDSMKNSLKPPENRPYEGNDLTMRRPNRVVAEQANPNPRVTADTPAWVWPIVAVVSMIFLIRLLLPTGVK